MTEFWSGVRRVALAAAAAGVFLLGCNGAWAQVGPPPAERPAGSPEELNPAGRLPAPAAQARRNDLLAPPAPGQCPLSNSSLTVTLTDVTFKDASGFPLEDLTPAYQPYLGKSVPVATICTIRDEAQNILFHEGILARIVIPPQKIAQGHLELRIIEAYVASVRVHGLGDEDEPVIQKVREYIDMLKGMKPFDINRAQRYLYLAGSLPGVHVSATLIPAPAGNGALILDITVAWQPVNAVLGVQNLGGKGTGPWGALARVDLNSFTDLGERTTVVGYTTFDFKEQRVIQGIEQVPIGPDGLTSTVSVAYGLTEPGDALAPLDIIGASFVGEGSLTWPFIRARHTNLNVTGGFDYVDQKVWLGNTATLTDDHLRILYGQLEGNHDFDWDLPVAVQGDLEIRKGLEILGASDGSDPDLSRIGGHPDAWLARAKGTVTVQFLPWLSTVANFAAQYSNERLLAYEDIDVGNLTIGRGYDPSSLTGDRGILGSIEPHVGPFPVMDLGSVTFMGFYDAGHVTNINVFEGSRTVSSVGGGIISEIQGGFNAEITYAHPLDKISFLSAAPPADTVLVNVTWQY